jgi:type IV secretory pathway TrbF-like protein
MSDRVWVVPADKDERAAKRQFVELYGSVAVTNTYLMIAVVCLGAVSVGLTILNARTAQALRSVKPVVIRVSETGQAAAVSPATLEYRPREAEVRYFLIEFIRRHYSRMRATVQEDYARSLYFLDERLAGGLMESDKKQNAIAAFLASGGPEIDITVRNVSIEDLRQPPYRAVVEFEKVFYAPSDRSEIKRERYVANVVFVVRDQVPNALIPVNPLGLTITYFREDQAFDRSLP